MQHHMFHIFRTRNTAHIAFLLILRGHMRLSTLILVVILALQSFLPCEDICRHFLNDGNSIEHPYSDNSHKRDEHSACCSPFCQCSCCSIEVVFLSEFHEIFSFLANTREKAHTIYDLSKVLSADISVWHPPKGEIM